MGRATSSAPSRAGQQRTRGASTQDEAGSRLPISSTISRHPPQPQPLKYADHGAEQRAQQDGQRQRDEDGLGPVQARDGQDEPGEDDEPLQASEPRVAGSPLRPGGATCDFPGRVP
jgi:hypothetical protein